MVIPLIILLGLILFVLVIGYLEYRIIKWAIPMVIKLFLVIAVIVIAGYFITKTPFGDFLKTVVGGALGDVFGKLTPAEESIKACADTNIFTSIDKWIDSCLKNPLISLPTIAAFLIIYGLLDNIRIFRNEMINVFLAITITLLSVISKFYIIIMIRLFRAMGYWSVGIFTVMFFFGTWYLLVIKRHRWGTQAEIQRTQKDQVEQINDQIRALNDAVSRAIENMRGAPADQQEIIKQQIEEYNRQINRLEATKRNIQRAVV